MKYIELSTGTLSVIICIFFILKNSADIIVPLASFYLLIICITDTLFSKIYNQSTVILVIISLLFHYSINGFQGLLYSISGLLLGFSVFLIPFILRLVGGGDIKAFSALGSLIGSSAIFQVFIYSSIIGGLIAIAYAFSSQRVPESTKSGPNLLYLVLITREISLLKDAIPNRRMRFPYATALAFGFFTYIQWGSVL